MIAKLSYRDPRNWLRSHECFYVKQHAIIRAAKAAAAI